MNYIILFLTGGLSYYIIELLYRGYSYVSMFCIGGLAFLVIGAINERLLTWEMPLIEQMTLAAYAVTFIELLSGLILNLGLGCCFWSYADEPYNLWGQICLLYAYLWWWLSLPAILLDDLIRDKWLGEDRHSYKII